MRGPRAFRRTSGRELPGPDRPRPRCHRARCADGKVFVANSGGTLTVILDHDLQPVDHEQAALTHQFPQAGISSAPPSLAVSGSTLYEGYSNGYDRVYNAATNAYVTTVNAPIAGRADRTCRRSHQRLRLRRRRLQRQRRVLQRHDVQRVETVGMLVDTRPPSRVGNDPVALAVAETPATSTWPTRGVKEGSRSSA